MKHKVLLVLLLGIIISVSASAQKVTMNLKQVKLEKVFSAITQQTGLTVAYSRTIVNPDRIVTVEAKNQELSKVLNDLFLGTNINYEIGKTKIYLKEKVTDSEQQTSNANKRNISGRVVDEKGEPIIGASVMVQGSSLGTITNVDGRYTLANVPENSTITVSYIGYITVNYAATSRNLSQVVLREDSKTLEEVVVVGYGTQKKVNLTGAVAIVSGDELTTRSAANLSQLLQGSVPNMNVNFSSGRPGQGGSFNIRGVNSISADAAPLTIIDGIEGDINKVNPNDVESISVLRMLRLLPYMVPVLLMELFWLQPRMERSARPMSATTVVLVLVKRQLLRILRRVVIIRPVSMICSTKHIRASLIHIIPKKITMNYGFAVMIKWKILPDHGW